MQHFGEEKEGTNGQFVNFWSFVGLFVFQTETSNMVKGKAKRRGRIKLDNLLHNILNCILAEKILVLKLGCFVQGQDLCWSLPEYEALGFYIYLPCNART